jgi:ubiquitin carboxyl-terminal hydrolase L3
MAVLHVALNLDSGKHVTGSELQALVKKAVELQPTERAELLYHSKFLEEAHMDAASQGCSIVPSPQEPCGFHFVAFVQKEGMVWELNGGMNGPLLKGEVEGDLLSERGLEITVNSFLRDAETVDHRGISIVAVSG